MAAGTGGFTLNTTPPGATVYVDGTRVPGTTQVTAADLSAGAHQVSVEMEGHGTISRSRRPAPRRIRK